MAWNLILAMLLTASVTTAKAGPPTPDLATPELTRAPVLTRFVAAEYPEVERAAGHGAAVTLRLSITAEGSVVRAEVVESAGTAFDAAALAAARQFVFEPAEIDGVASAIDLLYVYEFLLRDEPPVEPAPATAFSGIVRWHDSDEPIAGVRLSLEIQGAPSRVATTGRDGRFAFFDLPSGVATLRIAGEGLTAVDTKEVIELGQHLEVSYEVVREPANAIHDSADDLEIVVVAPAFAREAVGTRVEAEEARTLPGTFGDVVRIIENLPGVARSTIGSGQLVVWGAAPQATRIYVDGVPIPRLYHEGGLRSVIHPALVEAIELTPGGYGAPFGRGLGGLVRITTQTPERMRVSGRVAADILDASAMVAVPLGKKQNVHITVAARASYLDLWARRVLGPEVVDFVPIPRYGDGQLRTLWRPSSRDRIEVVGLAAFDRLQRGVPNPDPALEVFEQRRLDLLRLYTHWTRTFDRGGELDLTPFVGYTQTFDENRFGATATSIANGSWLAGLRASHVTRPRPWLRFDIGLDAEVVVGSLERIGALTLPAREGDIRVFGQPPPKQIAEDHWKVTFVSVAPYAQAELAPWNGRLRVVPGLRLDPYARSISRRNPADANVPSAGLFEHDFALEPRLAIFGRPTERLELRTAFGLYRQMPAAEDLSAAFGTPTLPVAKALHAVVGGRLNVVRTLAFEATLFFTRSRDLPVRSPAEFPLRARALETSGRGRAYGMQLLLRQELWQGLSGWIAYTLMRSERFDHDGAPARLFDFDQTHILTAVLGYSLRHGFELGARLRYTTGFPRTPVIGAFFDSTNNLDQPIFGTQNSIRIPDWVQFDVRVAKAFEIRHTMLSLILDVLNVWNQPNAEEFVYASDYSRRATIRSFPVLPVLGLQWDF